MKNKYLFVLLLLLSITLVSSVGTFFYVKLNKNTIQSADDSFVIMTSCNPVYIATLNVVGDVDGVTVQNLSQPTTGCLHDYTLTTEDMKNLSKADVLVVNGGGMEGYLEDVVEAYPELPIIDTYEFVETKVELPESDEEEEHSHLHEEAEEAEEHDHEAEHEEHEHEESEHDHEHHHHGANSHIWMDSEIFALQVQAIGDELAGLDKNHADAYTANCDSYIKDLDAGIHKQGLDESMAGANIAILHEAFEYTARSLGANVVATMDLDEERQVSAGEVSEFMDEIKEHDVKIVFAEYDYGNAMGKLIEEQTDAKVVYLETLVHGDYDADSYIRVINDNYDKIYKLIY